MAQGMTDELHGNFNASPPTSKGCAGSPGNSATRRLACPPLVARGIVEIIVFVLLDGDLVKHDYDEGGAENEFAFIFTRLGTPVDHPDPGRLHQPENYVGRILASVFTCGIYTLFWLYNIMDDGNRHFATNWVWEDSLAQAVQQVPQ